jgi:large subunit ribosomal protein L31
MKLDTHPTYFPQAHVKCACGNTFVVGSTKEKLEIEVCSSCHPFYIGDDSKKILAGRLEKFKTRQGAALAARDEAKKHTTARKTKKTPVSEK